jgi:hypothetical protein
VTSKKLARFNPTFKSPPGASSIIAAFDGNVVEVIFFSQCAVMQIMDFLELSYGIDPFFQPTGVHKAAAVCHGYEVEKSPAYTASFPEI